VFEAFFFAIRYILLDNQKDEVGEDLLKTIFEKVLSGNFYFRV